MWPRAMNPSRIGWCLLLSATRDAAAAPARAHSSYAQLAVQVWRAFGGLIGVLLICAAAAGVLFLVDWLMIRRDRLRDRDGDEVD